MHQKNDLKLLNQNFDKRDDEMPCRGRMEERKRGRESLGFLLGEREGLVRKGWGRRFRVLLWREKEG